MVDSLPVVSPPRDSLVSAGQPFDYGLILVAIIPFILFLAILFWGSKKKKRKQVTVQLSYNLIAIQLLFFLLLPVCNMPIDCGLWAIIPILMFAIMVFFVYQRMSREAQHKRRIAKAMEDGHIEASGLLQGKLEEEIHEAKDKPREEVKKKDPKEETREESWEEPVKENKIEKPRAQDFRAKDWDEPDHKEIEKIVHGVLKKKKS